MKDFKVRLSITHDQMSEAPASDGLTAPELDELSPWFPGYEIDRLIAVGGMGAVYAAVQKSLDRPVAIKILPRAFTADTNFRSAFESEAKAMARLNHPNLIGVYDFGEVQGMLYIIMELVPGKSLFHSAHGIAIDPGEVVRLLVGICSGLSHAHQHGILHRDIKPSNILLDFDAQPKVSDFGLARPIEKALVAGEDVFGTPGYTAPEVMQHSLDVDFRADIFSIGVLMHELLTGRMPADDPRPASEIAGCDPWLDAIVARATAEDPAARYPCVTDLWNDLRMFQTAISAEPSKPDAPIAAHGPSLGKIFYPFIFMVICAAAAGGYFWWKNQTPQSTASTVAIVEPLPEPIPEPVEESPAPEIPEPPPAVEEDLSPEPPAPPPVAEKEKEEPTTDEVESGISVMPDSIHAAPAVEAEAIDVAFGDEEAAPAAIAPIADMQAFLNRARGIMRGRAKKLLDRHESDLKDNLRELEQKLLPIARKAPRVTEALNALDAVEEKWHTKGGRIDHDIPDLLVEIDGFDDAVREFMALQENLDQRLRVALTSHARTYVLGLNKEIERLRVSQDVGAISLLEKEIRQTEERPDHFMNVLLGLR